MLLKQKKKYRAVFVIKEQGSFAFKKKKRLSAVKRQIQYKGGLYDVDIENPSYTKGLYQYYYIDMARTQINLKRKTNGKQPIIKQQLIYTENVHMSPKMYKKLLKGKLVEQLTSNLNGSKLGMNIMSLIVGAIMGALAGYVIAGFM